MGCGASATAESVRVSYTPPSLKDLVGQQSSVFEVVVLPLTTDEQKTMRVSMGGWPDVTISGGFHRLLNMLPTGEMVVLNATVSCSTIRIVQILAKERREVRTLDATALPIFNIVVTDSGRCFTLDLPTSISDFGQIKDYKVDGTMDLIAKHTGLRCISPDNSVALDPSFLLHRPLDTDSPVPLPGIPTTADGVHWKRWCFSGDSKYLFYVGAKEPILWTWYVGSSLEEIRLVSMSMFDEQCNRERDGFSLQGLVSTHSGDAVGLHYRRHPEIDLVHERLTVLRRVTNGKICSVMEHWIVDYCGVEDVILEGRWTLPDATIAVLHLQSTDCISYFSQVYDKHYRPRGVKPPSDIPVSGFAVSAECGYFVHCLWSTLTIRSAHTTEILQTLTFRENIDLRELKFVDREGRQANHLTIVAFDGFKETTLFLHVALTNPFDYVFHDIPQHLVPHDVQCLCYDLLYGASSSEQRRYQPPAARQQSSYSVGEGPADNNDDDLPVFSTM